jgi:DNA-binding beta-propeller fold protein YncE
VFVTGVEDLYTSRADYFTAAYDAATGYPVWASRYNGPAHQEDEGRILTVSADGSRVFVTGNSMNADLDWDYATVAYDAMTGTRLWASRYDGPAHSTDFPHAIQASPRGDVVFVTGESEKKLYAPDYTTIAYDTASGGRRWLRRYDGPGKMEDRAYGLAVAPDGAKIYVTGESWGTDTSSDYATIAYDAGSGSPLWLARYDGPLHRGDTAMAMAVVPDGHLMFVTGHSAGVDSGFDYTTIEYEG